MKILGKKVFGGGKESPVEPEEAPAPAAQKEGKQSNAVKKSVPKKKVPTSGSGSPVKKKPSTRTSNGAAAKAPVKKKKPASETSQALVPHQGDAPASPVKKKAPVKKQPVKKQPVKKQPVKKRAPGSSRNNGTNSTATTNNTPVGAIVPYSPPSEEDQEYEEPDNNTSRMQRNQANKIPKVQTGPKADEDPWANADPSKWRLSRIIFNGSATYKTIGRVEKIKEKDIDLGIKHFKANPVKYTAMLYQTSKNEYEYPVEKLEYQYIHREGTTKYEPQGVSKKGWMTMLLQEYYALPRFKDNILPPKFRDKYTDSMTFEGRQLHTKSNPPIMPGRGMGVCDEPNIKIIGDVDPSDIHQGQVGDCWLLSGISSLAEFDGAIKRLFRKTPNLDRMPHERPNKYIVTYWDLSTWTEVDIEIDERLAVDAKGNLLGAKPSVDGELWACYLEKAFAIHAGGWDKIVGGQCLHAWSVMTGCEYQYQVVKNKETGKYAASMRFNTNTGEWCKHANSPHDCDPSFYDCAWPDAGGGGAGELTQDELWEHMCAWDDANYIVAASTSGVNHNEAGLVDDHAYSVIECHNDVAGTPIDLIKVRNPWGKGEIEDGEFDDDGPGWDKWPQVKAAINPVVADDGIFYVTPDEFFKMFGTLFVSASDMTEFLED